MDSLGKEVSNLIDGGLQLLKRVAIIAVVAIIVAVIATIVAVFK